MRAKIRHRAVSWFLGLVLCVTTAACYGFFRAQEVHNLNAMFYPHNWAAQWIKAPEAGHTLDVYRKSFVLSQPPKEAYLIVLGDNFIDPSINDLTPASFFHPSAVNAYQRKSSVYNSLGFPRKFNRGVVFDVKSLLEAGRNVIGFKVQSDQKPARVAAELVIQTDHTFTICTDRSWKWAPVERWQSGQTWRSRLYVDSDWKNAAEMGPVGSCPVDGDLEPFTYPYRASFIAPSDLSASQHIFQKRFWVPPNDIPDRGWIRVSTYGTFNVSLDDYVLTSLMRSDASPLANATDPVLGNNLYRVEGAHLIHTYPVARDSNKTDIALLSQPLKAGWNTITVSVGAPNPAYLQGPPSVYVDAHFYSGDGKGSPGIRLASDVSWTVALTGRSAPAAVPSKLPAGLNTPFYTYHYMGLYGDLSDFLQIMGESAATFLGIWLAALTALYILLKPLRRGGLAGLIVAASWLPAMLACLCAVARITFTTSLQAEEIASASFGALCCSVILWTAIGSTALLAIVSLVRRSADSEVKFRQVPRWIYPILCAAAIVVAAVFSFKNISGSSYIGDEYVSVLAARGIARTGLPFFEKTGIYYTRSSLFHYSLGLAERIGGSTNALALHLVPILWGLATIWLSYKLAKELGGGLCGVFAAFALALSPYMLFYDREVRFYSEFAFFATLCAYLLLMSIRRPDDYRLPKLFFLSYCCAYLSQQFAVAILPAAIVVLLMSRQFSSWSFRRLWPYYLGTILVMLLDLVAYLKYCQTPLPFVDHDAMPLLGVHTDSFEVLPDYLLAGLEHSGYVLGILFVIGAAMAAMGRGFSTRMRLRESRALYVFTILCMVLTTIMATRPEARYIVQFLPIVVITACLSLVQVMRNIRDFVASRNLGATLSTLAAGAAGIVLFASILGEARPIRTWNSLDRKLGRDFTDATRFVRDHYQPGDIVIHYSPEAAMVEIGKCDYFWRPMRGSIFKYYGKDQMLRERNSGAIVLESPNQLNRVMMKAKRVWLVVPTEAVGLEQNKDLLNQDLEPTREFVLGNFKSVDEAFSVKVMLWDKSWAIWKPNYNLS